MFIIVFLWKTLAEIGKMHKNMYNTQHLFKIFY